MKLKTIWIVRDPSPYSTHDDICFEQTFKGLANYITGSPAGAWEHENHVGYTTYAEASADASARLDRRGERIAKLRGGDKRRSARRASKTTSGISRIKRIRRLGRGL